jgi:hypothetical protein
MTDVSQEEIDEARADLVAEALPDTCTIERATKTPDGGGGFKGETWAPIAEDVPCRLDAYGGATSSRGAGGAGSSHSGERIDTRTSHIIAMPHGTAIEATDHVVIGDSAFEVLVVRKRAAWELTRSVETKEKF